MSRRSWSPVPAADAPDHVILFDGVCVLCSRWVQFVIARDAMARFRFVAIQTPLGQDLAARFGIDPENPETNAVVANGHAYFKFDSMLEVLSELPGWRWARIACVLPRPLRDFVYDRIARSRYRLFGRRDTCLMPTPDIERRFLARAEPS
jgi:predicted DCC family thiol-disulfide oxidoreductase YuxK